jgi:hypothetical protein
MKRLLGSLVGARWWAFGFILFVAVAAFTLSVARTPADRFEVWKLILDKGALALMAALAASIATFAWTLYLDRGKRLREQAREDRLALGNASLLLLRYSQGNRLLADIPQTDRARADWRLLTEIARAIIPIRSDEYLPLAMETAYFVINRSFGSSPEEAVALFQKLSAASNPELAKLYVDHLAKLSAEGRT